MSSVHNTTPRRNFSEMRRGQTVKVRLVCGDLVERVVWDDRNEYVFLCSARCYSLLLAGSDAPSPIGFPRSDIEI